MLFDFWGLVLCAGYWAAPLRSRSTCAFSSLRSCGSYRNQTQDIWLLQFVYLLVVLRAVGPAHTAHASVTRQVLKSTGLPRLHRDYAYVLQFCPVPIERTSCVPVAIPSMDSKKPASPPASDTFESLSDRDADTCLLRGWKCCEQLWQSRKRGAFGFPLFELH